MPDTPGVGLLSTPNLRLFPLHPDDYRFLYWLATCEPNTFRWRYRGQLPPYEVFVEQLQADVAVQFLARDAISGDPVGLAVAYGLDLRNRHCYLGALVHPDRVGTGVGSEMLDALASCVFRVWDLHKVFAEVPAFTLEPMDSKRDLLPRITRSFSIEAVLSDYLYCDGRRWDMYVVSSLASAWLAPT